MYNKFMQEKEINVKVGDMVSIFGSIGHVLEVFHNIDTKWNGKEYVNVENTESTSVRVHFTDELAKWKQYQDGIYGDFVIIDLDEVHKRR